MRGYPTAAAMAIALALCVLWWMGQVVPSTSESAICGPTIGETSRNSMADARVSGLEEPIRITLDPSPATGGAIQERFAALSVKAEWDDATPAQHAEIRVRWLEPGCELQSPRIQVADLAGWAMFEGLMAGRYEVASPRGAALTVSIAPGEARSLTLSIPSGAEALLEVVDEEGFPVADAEVWVSHAFNVTSGWILGRTDRAGLFRDEHVPDGRYLGVRKSGFVASDLLVTGQDTMPGKQQTIVLLRGGATVSGTVRRASSGAAIPDALVCVGTPTGFSHSGRARGLYRVGPPPYLVRSSLDGSFRVDGVPGGTFPVVALADGLAPGCTVVGVEDGGEARADFWIESGCEIHGVVVDATNNPVEGALIGAGNRSAFDYMATRSDEHGRFALRTVPCSPVTVRASHTHHGTAETQFDALRSDEMRLVLTGHGLVRGKVVDAVGALQVGVGVEILGLSGAGEPARSLGKWETDGHGEFTAHVSRLTEGLRLLVRPSDRPTAMPQLEEELHNWPSEPLLLMVPTAAQCAATVQGRILDLRGGDTGRRVVILRSESGREAASLTNAVSGEFRFEGLCPGIYAIHVHCGELSVVASKLILGVGDAQDLGALPLPRVGRVRIRPVSPEPGESTRIRFLMPGGLLVEERVLWSTAIDVDLAAGSYDVEWMHGPTDRRRRIEVTEGRQIEVTLTQQPP